MLTTIDGYLEAKLGSYYAVFMAGDVDRIGRDHGQICLNFCDGQSSLCDALKITEKLPEVIALPSLLYEWPPAEHLSGIAMIDGRLHLVACLNCSSKLARFLSEIQTPGSTS